MPKLFLRLALALMLLSTMLSAQAADPGVMLQQRVDRLNQYLLHNRPHPEQIRLYLEREVVPFFAVDTMAEWAAGALGRHLDEQQRKLFTEDLIHRFMRAIAYGLADYPVSDIEYLPARGNPVSGEIQLGVRVISQTRSPVQLDFRLLDGEQGWRVVDVSANGLSAMNYYRQFYAEQAERFGVRGFIARLEMEGRRREAPRGAAMGAPVVAKP